MKKLFSIVLISLLLSGICIGFGCFILKYPKIVFAVTQKQASTTQTGDVALTATGGLLAGLMVITDGTNTVTMDIYDNATAASGKKLVPTMPITTSSTNRISTFALDVPYHNGLYFDITCSGTVSYMVYFTPGI
jgi:hypothetical protein